MSGELYGPSAGVVEFWLRCHRCERLLAEAISAPYKIRCRCGSINAAGMSGIVAVPEHRRRR